MGHHHADAEHTYTPTGADIVEAEALELAKQVKELEAVLEDFRRLAQSYEDWADNAPLTSEALRILAHYAAAEQIREVLNRRG